MLNDSKEFFFLHLKMLNCLKHLCIQRAEYYPASYLGFEAFFHQGLSVDTLYCMRPFWYSTGTLPHVMIHYCQQWNGLKGASSGISPALALPRFGRGTDLMASSWAAAAAVSYSHLLYSHRVYCLAYAHFAHWFTRLVGWPLNTINIQCSYLLRLLERVPVTAPSFPASKSNLW